MPTIREQLNSNIDLILNDGVPNQSIKPSDEANAIKLVADYADAIPVIKTVKTTITLAQLHLLNTNPVTILTSTSTISRFPLSIYILRRSTTNYTMANDYFDIVNSGGGFYGLGIPCGILAFSGQAYVYAALNLHTNGNPLNEASFGLKANVGNPAGGTDGIEVYVTYIETTI